MSKELTKSVKLVISGLENELARIDQLQVANYESNSDYSLNGVLSNKERHYRTAVHNISQSSGCLDIYFDDHASCIMTDTLDNEIKGLTKILNVVKEKKDKTSFRLEEIVSSDLTDLNNITDVNDLESLKRTKIETKEDFKTTLNILYPELEDDIKEILATLEKGKRNGKSEGKQCVMIDRASLCPALELLEKAGIIQQVKQQLYKLAY